MKVTLAGGPLSGTTMEVPDSTNPFLVPDESDQFTHHCYGVKQIPPFSPVASYLGSSSSTLETWLTPVCNVVPLKLPDFEVRKSVHHSDRVIHPASTEDVYICDSCYNRLEFWAKLTFGFKDRKSKKPFYDGEPVSNLQKKETIEMAHIHAWRDPETNGVIRTSIEKDLGDGTHVHEDGMGGTTTSAPTGVPHRHISETGIKTGPAIESDGRGNPVGA